MHALNFFVYTATALIYGLYLKWKNNKYVIFFMKYTYLALNVYLFYFFSITLNWFLQLWLFFLVWEQHLMLRDLDIPEEPAILYEILPEHFIYGGFPGIQKKS